MWDEEAEKRIRADLRGRFLIACTSCESLLHEATTGPYEHMIQHLGSIRIRNT